MTPVTYHAATALVAILLCSGVAHAQERYGVVLMHGKWGSPERGIDGLGRTLASRGMLVSTPVMPWSRKREYDADYTQALQEIEQEANKLKQQGATCVVVAGQSFGANAAIAYAGSGKPVCGIAAIGPGHTPELAGFKRAVSGGVATAKSMAAEGKAEERAQFPDTNQGRAATIRTTARAYLSYFDPDGMAAMPRSAAAIPHAIPLLWVVGTRDGMYTRGEQYAYARAPHHERSRYLVVDADHFQTPGVAADAIAAWIETLKP
jgi:dienelactone hydrolase